MLKDKLNGLIMESMKAGDKVRTSALRAIKTGIMQWETARENVGKTLDEATETNIIRKLRNQYIDAAKQCDDGKHDELVIENTNLAWIMEGYLPAPVSEEAVQETVEKILAGRIGCDAEPVEPIKKNMGGIMSILKIFYPEADGKMLARVVSKNLK